ncbi:hypothetical protein GOODEAATRI_030536 [Goodea atripinnis]|uniref:Uncharacterized protein n=1 Tax=Goodea atripinnis TaxID=208336 RepID=A0ABV0Q2D0_9TELE
MLHFCNQVNSTVPLIGRSGLLGDHKNSVFCGVACGRGLMVNNTYCVTTSGVLCLFNSRRQLEAWVDLKVRWSEHQDSILWTRLLRVNLWTFCIFFFSSARHQWRAAWQSARTLSSAAAQMESSEFSALCSHSSLLPAGLEPRHPDTLALSFDPRARRLTCVYTDHSVYVWDVRDVRNAGRLYSALYHSSCVWNIQDPSHACLPPSSFLTCSSDNTIRLWHSDAPRQRNLYSQVRPVQSRGPVLRTATGFTDPSDVCSGFYCI